jgi:hypothetical protein
MTDPSSAAYRPVVPMDAKFRRAFEPLLLTDGEERLREELSQRGSMPAHSG